MSSFRAGKIMVKTVSSEQILDSNLSQTSELHASHLNIPFFSMEKGMATHSSILAWRMPWTV